MVAFLRENAYSLRGRGPFLNAVTIAAGSVIGTIMGVIARIS